MKLIAFLLKRNIISIFGVITILNHIEHYYSAFTNMVVKNRDPHAIAKNNFQDMINIREEHRHQKKMKLKKGNSL
jgi:hypothetical protein